MDEYFLETTSLSRLLIGGKYMNITCQAEVQLPVYMNAEQLATYLGISRAGAYILMHSEGFPMVRINKRMLVASKKLIEWLEINTGK